MSGWKCPAPPAPVRDLLFESFYTDPAGSIVDPDALKRYRSAARPVVQYEEGLAAMSDLYVRSRPAEAYIARCVLDWLHAWAAGDAMLGRVTRQGAYVRKWALAAVAASYLKIGLDGRLDPHPRRLVHSWIERWARAVVEDYSTGIERASRRNNHLYWAAWSVILAAVVLDDIGLYEKGTEWHRYGLAQIEVDGTLPLELARKARALEYHVFAAAPLVLVAETLAANGQELSASEEAALRRLVRRTAAGLDDPSFFQARSGAVQEPGVFSGRDLAWMEPCYARLREPSLVKWIARFRPMRNRRLGGDLTLLFGAEISP